jgi:hypothetical protein
MSPPFNQRPARRSPSKKKLTTGMTVTIATDETMKVEHIIPHYKDMALDEIKSVWFSTKEMDRTMNECQETVQLMQDGILMAEDDEEITTRGLEYMTVSGFDITTSSLDAVKIVLEEQKRQREAGESCDAELFYCAVSGISRHRLRIAHLAGMKDARGVYGDGNFKTDRKAPAHSTSDEGTRREPRRGRLRATNSGGALADMTHRRRSSGGQLTELTRRRRGSRGPLKERERLHQSYSGLSYDPANEAATEESLQRIQRWSTAT